MPICKPSPAESKAADGPYLNTLADVAWALKHTKSNGKRQGQVRANVQMDVAKLDAPGGDDQRR